MGEAWVNSAAANAYFTQNNLATPFHHNATGVLDFQVAFAMMSGMSLSQGWTDGVNKLYMTLAQDFLYKNPLSNCLFLDNHDMDRIFSIADEDWSRLKIGLTWLLTLRGIPQLYYGAEVLMKNRKTGLDAASVREDFPGGWSEDSLDKFSSAGRNAQENEVFQYISRLANFRKQSTALTTGSTMQFIPVNGVYTYFRFDAKQTIMVIVNSNDKPAAPNWQSYVERTNGFHRARDVITGAIQPFGAIELSPKSCYVFELVK
jgi:glycosidase